MTSYTGHALEGISTKMNVAKSWVSLHEWDSATEAFEDRDNGIHGRQVSAREWFHPSDLSAGIEVVEPGSTTVYVVLWVDGVPWAWTQPMTVDSGDLIALYLERDFKIV